MAQNISQIYTLNPSTTMAAADLIYLGLSPYGITDDSAIKWSDLVASMIAEGAGGSTTQIQYNNAGALAGDTGFTTDGAGTETIVGQLNVDNLRLDGNTVSSTDAGGNIILAADTTGYVNVLDVQDSASVEVVRLEGNRATPTTGDNIFQSFALSNDLGTQTSYARLVAAATTITDGAEDGSYTINVIRAGALEETAVFSSTEIVLNESGVDRDFRVETSGKPNGLFLQGSDGALGLGTSNPQARIEALGVAAAEPSADWFTDATFGITFLDDQTQTAQLTAFAGDTAGNRPLNFGRRSRGTLDAPTAVASADLQFSLIASGYDGTDFQQGASFDFITDDTVSAGNVPTGVRIQTGDNSGARTTQFEIDSSGVVTLANALPVTSGGTGLSSTTANQLLYSSGTSTIAGLATANDGLLVTSATGVPSIGNALTAGFDFGDPTSVNQVVTVFGSSSGTNPLAIAQASGTLRLSNQDGTASNFTSLQNVDSNGSLNAQIAFINVDHSTNESSINFYTRVSGGAMALGATLDSAKDFTVVGSLTTSQTAGIIGTTTNNDANTGSVGEFVSSVIVLGSAVALTTATAANVTSISLTAGDWDVWGNVNFTGGATTKLKGTYGGINTSSATIPSLELRTSYIGQDTTVFVNGIPAYNVLPTRISVSGTTTVYLVGVATFSVSTCSVFGGMYARRVR